ncbi:hypothetical protein FNV43_RR10312 [Rhamnella rubrinervis]|uniref:Uncharacterized protein n=1 Tax=Rhamnella rubrinervis TaxID=2594499 RepID=A0A8K0HCF0_9ROSA|nr:hypothetical protein FNV43_RR10312 [Rhamnella rubrinervis]
MDQRCEKKEVAAQEEPSRRQSAYAPASTFGDECKEIRESEDVQRWELDRKKIEHRDDLGEQEALNAHLEHIRVEIPRAPKTVAVEENPKEEEYPEEEEEEDPEEYSEDE